MTMSGKSGQEMADDANSGKASASYHLQTASAGRAAAPSQTTSKSIHGVGEITLLRSLKTGLVPIATPMSYATRLRTLLTAYFADRKRQVERDRMMEGVLESLQIIRSVRWALLENDTKLLLSVTFDGPWEAYIRLIVEKAGPVLDSIFCHCDDYAESSCADGYPAFSAWVHKNQVSVDFLYDSSPDLTVQDVRYLKRFESAHAAGENVVGLKLEAVVRPPSPRPEESAYSLFKLSQLFPDVPSGGNFTDRQLFDSVARLILQPDFGTLLRRAAAAQAVSGHPQASLLAPTKEERAIGAWIYGLHQSPPGAENALANPAAFQRPEPTQVEDRRTVQGNILGSFSSARAMTHGAVVLLRFDDAASAQAFLEHIQDLITWETAVLRAEEPHVTFALTAAGLRTLGVDVAREFPKEFSEGMAARAGLISDVGFNSPENWRLPELNWPSSNSAEGAAPFSMVDGLLVLQARNEARRDEAQDHLLLDELRAWLEHNVTQQGVDILHVQPTRHFDDWGHLGAVDGVSQPVAQGEPVRPPYAARDVVPVGDLLLGYQNSHGERSAPAGKVFQNSTFIAVRKMMQNVKARDLALPDEHALRLALGRGSDGESALRDPAKTGNDFDYASDVEGKKCPLFSHVRRAHPRDPHAPSPRILRRGMSYGPRAKGTVEAERGVIFMAIAASLADQYEVVQRWVNGGNSTGLSSAHPDLVAGTFPAASGRVLGAAASALGVPSEPLAVLRWGFYAFVPSASALLALRGRAEESPAPAGKLLPFPSASAASEPDTGAPPLTPEGEMVKAKIEDRRRAAEALRYWQDVLRSGGIVREPEYATMVGKAALVDEVLRDHRRFSVRSYHERMAACQATIYLGMDPEPAPLASDQYANHVRPGDYARESGRANAFIDGIGFAPSFAHAYRSAQAWLVEQIERAEARAAVARASGLLQGCEASPLLDLSQLSARVMRDVACKSFGLPESLLTDAPEVAGTENELRCPVDFTQVFQHVFPPRPSQNVSAQAVLRGPHIHEKIEQWIANEPLEAEQSNLIAALRGAHASRMESTHAQDYVVRTTAGVVSGFVVPTHGTLQSVLALLVFSDQLWRLQRQLQRKLAAFSEVGLPQSLAELAPLDQVLYRAMMTSPVPDLVHRTVMADGKLGKQELQSGELLALNLGVAARDVGGPEGWKYLFGDAPAKECQPRPVHACPGQNMAFGVLAGALCALSAQPGLVKVEANPLSLRLARR